MDMYNCAPASFAPVYNFDPDQRNAMHNAMAFPPNNGQYMHSLNGLQYMSNPFFAQSRHHLMADRGVLGDGKNESKPRLSKEEVDSLEKVFQENSKPSSSLKAHLADKLGLERPRINNWFQNRRAKAKQEKKQEEYEASRAAEKDSSEPDTPEENASSVSPETVNDSVHPRHQPSSAAFRDVNAGPFETSDAPSNDENHDDSDALDSPFAQQSTSTQDDTSDVFQSPLSCEFSPIENSNCFAQTKHNFATPYQHNGVYTTIPASAQHHHHQANHLEGLPTPENSMTETLGIKEDASLSPLGDESVQMMRFKSPPPPSDIASRRKRAGPATLQTTSLNNRPPPLGSAQKVAMDGSRRPSSPMTTMRRITSGTGNIPNARIQKATASPRSPMFFGGRNADAYLQYRMRSPVGSASTQFSGAPPTPMTPAVMGGQQGHQEPTITSMCPDDDAYHLAFAGNMMPDLKIDTNLKTPPTTPGYLANANFSAQNFAASQVGTSLDQPLITPFLQADFGDLGLHAIPGYVDMNDGSMPSTPLYPTNMITPSDDQLPFTGSANGSLQYDWDANESVTSKSSPGMSRSQVQFTQNMTPQDYTPGMDC